MKNGPYTLVIAPPDYPGKRYRDRYAYAHHVVYWRYRRRIPKKGEIVHHRNGIRTDNRIQNLELLTCKQHLGLHSRGRTVIRLMCLYCGCKLIREKRKVYNLERTFCSKSHSALQQQKETRMRQYASG